MRLAKQAGAFTVAIVNVVSSTIAREADGVLYTWAGPEIAVATTKAYSAQLAALYLNLGQDRAHARPDLDRRRARAVRTAAAPAGLHRKNARMPAGYAAYRDVVCHRPSVFFLGRGLDYAAALEASLKLKENLLYPLGGPMPAGELKHGTISLIEGRDAGRSARNPACAV